MMKTAPSILSADFLHLEDDIRMLNGCADYIHIDVMDGTFVPNISFGFSVIDQLGKVATIPMDAHLMTVHPERWFSRLADDKVSLTSFHLEAAGRRSAAYLEQIRSLGMKAGLAIDPDVPVEKLFPYIGKADFFLIMSVFAGFGGQKFIYESLDRVSKLKAEIDKRGDKALIEVDGGVNVGNAAALREAGADIIVAGSAVFKADDPQEMIRTLAQA